MGRRGIKARDVYLSDKAVGGGVRGGAAVRALEAALPLGVLSLRECERTDKKGKVKSAVQLTFIPTCSRGEKKPCLPTQPEILQATRPRDKAGGGAAAECRGSPPVHRRYLSFFMFWRKPGTVALI